MPRADAETLLVFNRRRDRLSDKYVFISDVELAEQGINDEPHALIGKTILYNGVAVPIVSAGRNNILFERFCVVTDFIRFVENVPRFECPCGLHQVDAVNYNYCTQGQGRLLYDVGADLRQWFHKNGKQHTLISRRHE